MRGHAGYTIIEVTLFLALSGLIALAVLLGYNGTINNNRIADTTKSLEAEIIEAYSSVQAGQTSHRLNSAGYAQCSAASAFPGASNACIAIGRLLVFEGQNVVAYSLVANANPTVPCTQAGVARIVQCYSPRVLAASDPADAYQLEWQARASSPLFMNGPTSGSFNMLAFVRDPDSEFIYTLPVNGDSRNLGPRTNADFMLPDTSLTYANQPGQICVNHDIGNSRTTYIRFNGGDGIGSVDSGDIPPEGVSARC